MKINPTLLSLSCAVVAAFLWTFCNLLMVAVTITAMNLSGETAYLDFGNFSWRQAFVEFLRVLIKLCGIAGLTGWLIAVFYNFLNEMCGDATSLK